MRILQTLPLFVILMGVASAAMLVPALYGSILNQDRIAQPFFYSAILFGFLTAMIALATAGQVPHRQSRHQLLTLLAAFAVLPAMLAVPLYEAVPGLSYMNAYFEMVSSITTTGATVFDVAGRVSEPVHIWRALVGWMGGLLTLVTAVALLAPMNLAGFEVLRPKGEDAAVERAIAVGDPNVRLLRFAGRIFPIYLGATLVLWCVLAVLGMDGFSAVMFAMSTLATSGIVPDGGLRDMNIGVLPEIFIALFLVFSLSRQTLLNDFNRGFVARLRMDREMRLAAVFIVSVPLFLFLRHWIGAFEINDEDNIETGLRALWGSLFTVISFLTTSGFISGEWDAAQQWSGLPTPGLIFAGLAIVGGGVATTAGGVKLLRVYALYKHGIREMELLVHPNSVGSAGVLGRVVRRQGAVVAWVFFMLFALSVGGVTVALAATGQTFEQATIFAISALSNTGPLAPYALEDGANYTDLRGFAKTILMGAMVLGRLETLAIIALFNPDFWRR